MSGDALFDVPGHQVDDQTAAILAAVYESPANLEHRRLVVSAIVRDGASHRGVVDPNRVRATLTDPTSGALRVKPQVLSATYQRLRAAKYLTTYGHVISTDRSGGNSGKPLNLWRLHDATT